MLFSWGAKMIESHSSPGDARPLSKSHAARSMAWCCLGNAAAAEATSAFLLRDDPALREGLIDAALADMSPEGQPRKEVRQSAAAFAYNVAHGSAASVGQGIVGEDDVEVPDLYVTLLCGALEGLADEVDPTVKLRRLLITGKILRSGKDRAVNQAAKSLVGDLGFLDSICSISKGSAAEGNEDARSLAEAANELNKLLRN